MKHSQALEAGCPLEPREGGKFAGLVEFVGIVLNLLPHAAGALEALVLLVGYNAVAYLCTALGRVFPKSARQIQH